MFNNLRGSQLPDSGYVISTPVPKSVSQRRARACAQLNEWRSTLFLPQRGSIYWLKPLILSGRSIIPNIDRTRHAGLKVAKVLLSSLHPLTSRQCCCVIPRSTGEKSLAPGSSPVSLKATTACEGAARVGGACGFELASPGRRIKRRRQQVTRFMAVNHLEEE